MENEDPTNQMTKCPPPSTSGLAETLGSDSTICQSNFSEVPSSATYERRPASLSETALLSGSSEIESRSGMPLPSHIRACSNASSMLALFCSVRDISAFLRSRSPDVVEAYREFLKFSQRGEVAALVLPEKLRTLADEFDTLLKGEAAQRPASPAARTRRWRQVLHKRRADSRSGACRC